MKIPAEVQFAQKLAANEKLDRDKGVKKLKKWFQTRSAGAVPFQEDELLRIWKGLFYCYWMSDKPLVQEELAVNISSMIDSFSSTESALLFIKTFFLTMGREWFGIDKWRMDKFMLMARRFLRQVFKYNRKHGWDIQLTNQIKDTLAENLLLLGQQETSLGFQMHITDVFLEELAKVGGEELKEQILHIYLQPFIKVVTEGREQRLRAHVVERIFNHLLRQSDCGIEWDMEKDLEALGKIQIDESEPLADGEDGEEGEDGDDDVDMDEEPGSGKAEDPRAGRVDVELPQLKLNYLKLADLLFQLGSRDSTMVANRNILYSLSKRFQDVGNNVFPLGDDISDEETDEKINMKESVEKLLKKDEKLKKKNQKTKEEFRKWKKEQKKLSAGQNGYHEDLEMADFEEESDSEKTDNKRKMEEDEEEESPEAKKARIEENKHNKIEKNKKRKQEQKRAKRERLLAEKIKVGEEKRKADLLLERDIEIRSAMDLNNEERTENKSKNKKDLTETVATTTLKETTEKVTDCKKMKKNKFLQDSVSTDNPLAKNNGERDKTKKKKKKVETEKEIEHSDYKPVKNVNAPEETSTSEKKKKIKKKKNKESKEKDSVSPLKDIKFDQTNSTGKKQKKKKRDHDQGNPTEQPEQSEKKKKNRELEETSEPLPKPFQGISATKKKSKKEKINGTKVNGETTRTQLFDESADWDTPSDWAKPLLPGEQEIVLVNKKYKGATKLPPPAAEGLSTSATAGFPEFDSPKMSTPKMAKTHTAVFLKKAMSKTMTPKVKVSKVESLKLTTSSSEPRPKRVNFALTKNMSQDISDLYSSIANSPGIPHDPTKNPEKSLLKRSLSAGSLDRSMELHPLHLNTQLNSITSKKTKLMGKKRMKALEFF